MGEGGGYLEQRSALRTSPLSRELQGVLGLAQCATEEAPDGADERELTESWPFKEGAACGRRAWSTADPARGPGREQRCCCAPSAATLWCVAGVHGAPSRLSFVAPHEPGPRITCAESWSVGEVDSVGDYVGRRQSGGRALAFVGSSHVAGPLGHRPCRGDNRSTCPWPCPRLAQGMREQRRAITGVKNMWHVVRGQALPLTWAAGFVLRNVHTPAPWSHRWPRHVCSVPLT